VQTKVSSFIVIFEGYNIFGIVIQFGLSVNVCVYCQSEHKYQNITY